MLNLKNIEFGIADSERSLIALYRLQHKVFVEENQYIINIDENSILKDLWDITSAKYIYVKNGNKIIGGGRNIYNSEIGFRVSSSINLNNFFSNLDKVCEISGLAVVKEFRHYGIGNIIQYLRILIAINEGMNHIIASCYPSSSIHFEQMGFTIKLPSFEYKQYKTNQNSVFLCFNCTDSKSIKKMEKYFKDLLPEEIHLKIKKQIK